MYTQAGLAAALDTADAFVVYEGHSRYGQGPAFGDPGIAHVPDKKTYPVNPWGVHFRMGYDATDTECIEDLVGHSVTPAEYDLTTSGAKAFLPRALGCGCQCEGGAERHQGEEDQGECRLPHRRRVAAVQYLQCRAGGNDDRARRPTAEWTPFLRALVRKPADEFMTAVQVGSADIDKSSLTCKLLFMASCSSHVHFFQPLDRRRKAAKSTCKFLMTAEVCATWHATTFLEQVLIKGLDPMTASGMKALVKA